MPASAVPVAVCQFAPTASKTNNIERIATLTAQAAAQGARLVVFPEYAGYFVNPMDETYAAHAESLGGEFVATLITLAAEYAVMIVAGFIEATDAGGDGAPRVRNALVAVDGSGVCAVYRKQHLYDAFGETESDWIEAGELKTATFDLVGIRFGLMTCYDLRFPEVARTLADAGADAIIVPAEWVRGPLKEHHWTTLLAARAIENTAYVIAADHPSPIGVGLSQVIDPQGVVVAGVSAGEGIAVSVIDPGLIARVREVNPVLRVRRYGVVPRE